MLIPAKNTPALVGYYLGVFALIPVLGLLLGPVAVICGGIGLAISLSNRENGGLTHSLVAIVLGLVAPVVWFVVLWAIL